jgi:hypothetical protein
MKFSKEDIELIEKFIEIKNKGFYADGKQLTEVYNRVLERNVNITNCGSCLRGRVQELENALRAYRTSQEALKTEEPISDTPEENNKPVAKKVGRPKKN